MGAIAGFFKKIGKFLISKPFLIGLAVLLLVVFCVLFWIYSPLLAFNDINIFGSLFVRGFIIFLLKPYQMQGLKGSLLTFFLT